MKTDKDGRIAYHSYQIREDGFYYVQRDFDGTVESEEKLRDYNQPIPPKQKGFWDFLFGSFSYRG